MSLGLISRCLAAVHPAGTHPRISSTLTSCPQMCLREPEISPPHQRVGHVSKFLVLSEFDSICYEQCSDYYSGILNRISRPCARRWQFRDFRLRIHRWLTHPIIEAVQAILCCSSAKPARCVAQVRGGVTCEIRTLVARVRCFLPLWYTQSVTATQ